MTMANVIYDHFVSEIFAQTFNLETATIFAMLVTNSYTPNPGSDTHRSDVTNEVVGTGYTAGGQVVACTVTLDTTGHALNITFADTSWASSTITARGVVIYNHRGGAASADELICAATFGADVSSSGGTFTIHQTAPLSFAI